MSDQLVKYHLAEAAFKKGYKENTLSFYLINGNHEALNDRIGKLLSYDACYYNPTLWKTEELYPAPTQSELRTWLRDKHKIDIEIKKLEDGYKSYAFRNYVESVVLVIEFLKNRIDYFPTYEEALECALYEGIRKIDSKI